MPSSVIRYYFKEDYSFMQSTLRLLAWFGSIGHLLFYFVLLYLVGYWESLPVRIAASALFLSLLLLPKLRKFNTFHIVYYEFVYTLVFPVMFLFFLVQNNLNAYWAASVLFSAVLYGFLTHPPKALLMYPLSIAVTLLVLVKLNMLNQPVSEVILIHFPAYFIMILIGILQTQIRYANTKAEKENARSESLLRNILPEKIINTLKNNPENIAEKYEETSILFADIAGFTPFTEKSKPEEVVEFLNDIFTRFDALSEKYKIEKIKTIGDAYMVVSGAPVACANHAEVIADMALDMLAEIKEYNASHSSSISIRIGINSGPVVAGVIGKKKFAYDIWGDTVNTASRMESNGIPGKIQITGATAALLNGKFLVSFRGELDIKGKGVMKTYFLEGKN
ncbi:MAG TPA: adenylate/guanylate cyclase domain-containing protein [Bacteroidales bacterium]|nr:adenylate/guanylate cyclase domain-containing protein [Bacteroidales bacterium]HQP03750.1 adenylate/guanylate cyclase domain-containing protein [Bacteroidales bacterium]